MRKVIDRDENYSPNEEEMAFLGQHFTSFFRNRKNLSRIFKKDISRYGKKKDYEDESDHKPGRNYVNQIKCFEHGNLGHLAVNYP